MDRQDFYNELMNNVRTHAEVDSDFTESAFLREATERLIDAEEVTDLTAVHFTGSGIKKRRLAVSAYEEDETDGSVALAIVHFDDGSSASILTETEAKRQFAAVKFYIEESLNGFFQEGREESTEVYLLADRIRRRARSVSRYRLYLLTNMTLSARARDLPSESIDGIPIEFHVWDIERFRRVYESALGREELTIDLTEWASGGVPALKAAAVNGDTTTYLCVLPARLIADLYGRYGSRLLQSNVRSYLSNRGGTNRGIRETVLSEPELFLAYNNGITATATAVDVREGSIINVTDLQIVNGGQTTASLFYAQRERKRSAQFDEAYVQAKLVVVSPERAQELVPNISRYANSQNKVSEADFFSNSPFHVRMEELSRRIMTPAQPGSTYQSKWFYERTRGQYASEKAAKLGKSAQDTFIATYPKNQVISKTDAAKYAMSWDRMPHRVSTGPQKNFAVFAEEVSKEWESSKDSFNDVYFKELVGQAILYHSIYADIRKQPWFQKGTNVPNIVAYTVAKISDTIGKAHQGKFNFDAVWQKQAISESTANFAMTVAEQVLAVLEWPDRPKPIVAEWAKDEACWKRVQAIGVGLPEDFSAELIPGEQVRSAKKAAREMRQVDDGIKEQSAVLAIPREEWLGLKRFAEDNRLIGPTDAGILEIVTRTIPGLPTARQSARLMELFRRATASGYGRDRDQPT